MLNAEAIADDLIAALRTRLPAAVTTMIAATDTRVPVAPPAASSYFLGEYVRWKSYQLPACFVIWSRSPLIYSGPDAGANIDKWEHQVLLDLLVENGGPGAEEALTRACFRLAEAAYACLHDQDITRAGVSSRATKVFVESVDYGPMLAKGDVRTFRKDVFLTLRILHHDRETMAA